MRATKGEMLRVGLVLAALVGTAGRADAVLILFPGTAQQVADVNNTGTITIAAANAVAVPGGGGATFSGTVKSTIGINSIVLTITNALIFNPSNLNNAATANAVLFAQDNYNFPAGPGTLTSNTAGSLTTQFVALKGKETFEFVVKAGTFNNNNAVGTFAAPANANVKKTVPVAANDNKIGAYAAGVGLLQSAISYDLGPRESLVLPNSFDAIAAVPEPSTLALASLGGLIGAAWRLRARRPASAT